MLADSKTVKVPGAKPTWYGALSKYAQPDIGKARWQVINTFTPYLAVWVFMVILIQREYSPWVLLPLAFAGSALMVRIFILFHDCTHGSFFASPRGNKILGYVAGILTFTPYDDWRRAHGIHHNTVGDLDRRGIGDIWTMTVAEYLAAPRLTRLTYRIYRNPLVLFGLGPIILFLFVQRFPTRGSRKREYTSVVLTNLAILAIVVIMSVTIGWRSYLLIQLPMLFIASIFGVWIFYVQHQFEGVYWARHAEWDPLRAALEGSSFYRLPGALQWITGHIGLHHLHHLRPRIPNYHLQSCYDDIPDVRALRPPLTIRGSLGFPFLNLWDEAGQKLVGFRSIGQ